LTEPLDHIKEQMQEEVDDDTFEKRFGKDMDYYSEIFNKSKIKSNKKGDFQNATHEFDLWDEAKQDTEFWDN
jgi:hypothetical protein